MRVCLSLCTAVCAVSLTACSAKNNLFLGEVQADLDGHPTRVTDCYRWSPPNPERLDTGAGMEFRWTPCRDAVIVIRGDLLIVNNQAYGKLATGQRILVDHGKVSIE